MMTSPATTAFGSVLLLPLLVACAPSATDLKNVEQVGFRTPSTTGPTSGERGNVVITEVMWSGSVTDDGHYDPADVFVEVRNEGSLPVNLSHWRLVETGAIDATVIFPATDKLAYTGDHMFIAAKAHGCFTNADFVNPDLRFPVNGSDSIELTLLDADERLLDSAGATDQPPFAGGWDTVTSRSMEKVELIFGGDGTATESWHFFSDTAKNYDPNTSHVAPTCHSHTLASPGVGNSADYSGAYASGSLD